MSTISYKAFYSILLASAVVFTSQLVADDDADLYGDDVFVAGHIQDPLEPINRITFKFNDFVLLNVVEPVAVSYQAITPDPVEAAVGNFFSNLHYPVRMAGQLLQGRFDGAWIETGRFAINSTIGIVGIFTPADSVKGFAPIPAEDIGQALGAWGLSEGPYVVLPLLGPSNLRDLGGFLCERAVNPLQEPFSVLDDLDWEWELALAASELISDSPTLVERYKQLKANSIDPYSAIKSGYTQYRKAAIAE